MQQPATPSTPVNNAPSASPSAATAPAASAPAGASSTPIRINSAKQHGAAGGGDTLAHPATPHSHSMPGTPQQQPQSSSVPTGGHLLQLQAPLPSAGGGPGAVTPSGLSSMGASNQSLGVSVGAASSVSGISITPPNSAGLRQSTGEWNPLLPAPLSVVVVFFSPSPFPCLSLSFNVTHTHFSN
ncbi:GD19347 [Drosophila simulans]|uniref:GD19347 n=1 Tax=Drosophila simulans TaxID=7240 RepID=B4QS48_DROSI|nr:GD19347 [Drosophila simulans]